MSTYRPFQDDFGTVSEMEHKISSLESSNFDLKLRLHYLTQKYRSVPSTVEEAESAASMTLQTTPSSARERASPPTSDLVQRSFPGERETDTHSHTHRDRDREAAELDEARSENDYLRRRVVELETQNLQLQLQRDRDREELERALASRSSSSSHSQAKQQQQEESRKRERDVALAIAEHDAALIQKLQEELAVLSGESESDKKEMVALREERERLRTALEEKDKEIARLLERQSELESSLESERLLRLTQQNALSAVHPRSSSALSHSPESSPLVFSASSNGQQTAILINTTTPARPQSPGLFHNGNSHSNKKNASFVLQANEDHTSFTTSSVPWNEYSPFSSSLPSSASAQATPFKSPLHLPLQREQELSLREENAQLRERLQRLQHSIDSQDAIIKAIKESAQQMKTLEENVSSSGEREREREIDRLVEERDSLRQRCQKLERDCDAYQKDVVKYRRMLDEQQKVRNKLAPASTLAPPAVSTPGLSEKNKEIYERTIEMYRQREHELLAALEGVVKRCQELETDEKPQSVKRKTSPIRAIASSLQKSSPLISTPAGSAVRKTPPQTQTHSNNFTLSTPPFIQKR